MRGAPYVRGVLRPFSAHCVQSWARFRCRVPDPVTQCILRILSRDVPEPKRVRRWIASAGWSWISMSCEVVPPIELAQMLGDYPDVRSNARTFPALNKIFALHHNVTLDHLWECPREEVIIYLSSLDGLEDYTGPASAYSPCNNTPFHSTRPCGPTRQQEIIDPAANSARPSPFWNAG